jgi:hypothetical protein
MEFCCIGSWADDQSPEQHPAGLELGNALKGRAGPHNEHGYLIPSMREELQTVYRIDDLCKLIASAREGQCRCGNQTE